MATWQQVKELIQSKYPTRVIDENFLRVELRITETRSQILGIRKTTSQSNAEWVQVCSPIGLIPTEKLNDALKKVNEIVFGGLVMMHDKHFLRECIPLSEISSEGLITVINVIVGFADEIEEEFLGVDTH